MVSKEQIIELIQRGYAQEEEFIQGLSDEERSRVGSEADWSAKDMIAHTAAWKSYIAGIIADARHGIPAPKEESVDNINAGFYAAHHDKPWDVVLADAEYAKNELAAQTRALTDEELNDPAWLGASNNRPIWRRVVGDGFSHPLAHLVDYYAKHGQQARGVPISKQIAETLRPLDDSPDWQATQTYNLACYYAQAGDREQALALLGEALRANPNLTDWSKEDPDLVSLRDDPRYAALYAE